MDTVPFHSNVSRPQVAVTTQTSDYLTGNILCPDPAAIYTYFGINNDIGPFKPAGNPT
jgi:hypothetical protein